MIAAVAPPGTPRWRVLPAGSAEVVIAERDALGTTARLAVWPAGAARRAAGAVDHELARLDLAASRFRPDSELSRVHALAGQPVTVSAALAEAVRVALAAAAWTDGLVDPTIGAALVALGYDRDFVEVLASDGTGGRERTATATRGVPGWRCIRLTGQRLRVPAGVLLDLGATAKGLGADRAARAALATARARGVLVSLGGDLAATGDAPERGWPVVVADGDAPPQVVRVARGGLATSSVTVRQWIRSGAGLHHIVDPRTGRPADSPWRTVSVTAATCADANAAATAAIIRGADAPGWLTARGIQARLVGQDGSVLRTGGWPGGHDGQLSPPVTEWLPR
jgi:thiamine biosynthesis lipoprotein